jgi:putative modified peptide
MPHEVRMDITREDARALLSRLAEDDDFRREFESNTREILARSGIEVGDETLPETVVLPEKAEIRLLLALLETSAFAPEEVTPLGYAIIICALAAMPVLAEDRPALDGTG